MPSTTIRAKGSHASPRPGVPMSERQQMALLMQMTSNEQLGFENELHPSTSSAGAVALKSPSGAPGPSPRRRRNERGETPLHVAAIKGDELQVRRLIAERGADPNAKDFAGWTPLHEACNKGWYGVASALLEAGASVNARGYDDITPLHDAAVNGHAKLVRLLVSSGADVTQRNRRGKTPGDEAAPGLDKTLFRDAVFDNAENSATDVANFHAPPDAERPDVLTTNSTAVPTNHEQDSGALCEMRKAPLQHKGDSKSGSTRVTLRLHQLKPRDEKRRSSSSANAVNYYSESMEGKTPDTAAESKVKEEPSAVVPEADKPAAEKTAADDNAAIPEKEKTPEPSATAKKPGPEPGTVGAKRSLTESMEGAEDGDEESKKKKRRDSDAGKDVARNGSARPVNSAKNTTCTDKTTKPAATTKAATAVVPSKVAALGTSGTGDRKSPVGSQSSGASPKPATKPGEAEEEGEEMPLAKSATGGEGGPKVPPLKIVIPQQSAALEQEQGVRNGKNGKTHQALPYVVASSSSNDSVPDKDGAPGSAAPSPPDCGAAGAAGSKPGGEEKKDSLASLTAEERSTHQRVLRSSHRSGGSSSSSSSGGQPPGGSAANPPGGNNAGSNASSPQPGSSNNSVGDRNSNNSSPHLSISQRQSPSPDVVPPPTEAAPTAAAVAKAVCVTPPAVEQVKMEVVEPVAAAPAPAPAQLPSVELHPRKRKLKQSKEPQPAQVASTSAIEPVDTSSDKPEVHPHEQPITNCYQLFLDIRKQIERRRKGLFPVQPKPPSGFKDYLMNRCTYVLAGNSSSRLSIPNVTPPQSLQLNMKELFADQEKERYRLRMQHVIEKEKLVLSVEQEILRVHGRAARALANQSLPFSVCTILKDEEVYNVITPEQEEKDRNARSRYNGRLFISWLQDVDDKWEKIKESMLLRHHNEAESLHAVQKMDWEWKMKELGICEFKAKPVIEDLHVPMVHVSDDFDLLPA